MLPTHFPARGSPSLTTEQESWTQTQLDHSRTSVCGRWAQARATSVSPCELGLPQLPSVSTHLWPWGGISSTQTRNQLKPNCTAHSGRWEAHVEATTLRMKPLAACKTRSVQLLRLRRGSKSSLKISCLLFFESTDSPAPAACENHMGSFKTQRC